MNHNSFTQVYLFMFPRLVRYVNKRINNVHTAEELVHDVFTRYIERDFDFDMYNPRTKNSLYRAASNAVVDHFRKEGNRPHKVVITGEGVIDDRTLHGLEHSIIEAEVVSTMHRVLETCAGTERDIFCRRYLLNEPVSIIQKDYSYSRYHIGRMVQSVNLKLRDGLAGYFEDMF
jgi:RNA polymerase sigma factor (sigma-70 family)